MEYLTQLFQTCSNMQKAAVTNTVHPQDTASEIQLNAFEFRNYRTNLEATQQKIVERIVNQLCASLVRGKMLRVNDKDERVYMDKDLLGLLHDQELYPLKDMSRLEMLKDSEFSMDTLPYCIELEFRMKIPLNKEPEKALVGQWCLKFSFEDEDQCIKFALTLRILRTRDPALDDSVPLEVFARSDDDYDEGRGSKPEKTYHYNIDAGFPIVFSVSDLKIYNEIRSSSRHVYLEFFVRYPRQEKFLYAKSSTAPVPQKVLRDQDDALKKRKDAGGSQEDEDRRGRDSKKDNVVNEKPKDSMTFDLKNVKLKIPKVPHTIFGRLMAKDEFFPTAIGTFEFDFKKNFLQDRRKGKQGENTKKEPETLQIPMMSTWKVQAERKGTKEDFQRIGILTIRVLGYIVDPVRPEHPDEDDDHEDRSDTGGETGAYDEDEEGSEDDLSEDLEEEE